MISLLSSIIGLQFIRKSKWEKGIGSGKGEKCEKKYKFLLLTHNGSLITLRYLEIYMVPEVGIEPTRGGSPAGF